MNDKRYQYILYVIVTVIIATITIQAYWNYKNYLTNKQQLKTDVQVSLDKAVDDYYARLAEKSTFGIFLDGDQQKNALAEGSEVERLLMQIDSVDENKKQFVFNDSFGINNIKGITVLKGKAVDSMENFLKQDNSPNVSQGLFKYRLDSIKEANDSLNMKNIEFLTSKIVVSITNDSLNVAEVDSLLKKEFQRKEIGIKSQLKFFKSSVFRQVAKIKDSLQNKNSVEKEYELNAISESTFLPKGSILELEYSNETLTVLKRSLSGILISIVLVLAVISCLFYLLKIIKNQKQLAEVKNDLISNITHEFKTPIATIGVALESINNFNGIDDKEKTKKYLDMSSEQLGKLNIMVEKLLETATLDSDKLKLQLETVNVVDIIEDVFNRYEVQFPKKEFRLSLKAKSIRASVDVFHFENAINNLFDNAVKYGGPEIFVDVLPKSNHLEILISDNGKNLSKADKERIFEKFYRVPKGNRHDVKGFGIGLFYTKTIIEKLGGTITVEINNALTTFKITLPNG
ncbi:HAMP domain-containing histidine kinase [Winogradskyella sp. DF17]|uniref:histidine kinase n=1 Tax=Winogradskyella pelagia TaxID=2819984 RepID=A0ABS3T3P5_9FLAO|nr:HAMP domain-containing sensor histidine kinase [Winogradskyella sp. DF17]MBO3117079.1 HAMP domain-containing histidine kinase [Winogradskyella sp. DF17]